MPHAGVISLSPPHGSQLGGTAHLVTLSGTHVFHPLDNITCLFDGLPVRAFYLNSSTALCVSPELKLTGLVDFKASIERSHPSTPRTVLRARSGYMNSEFRHCNTNTCIASMMSACLKLDTGTMHMLKATTPKYFNNYVAISIYKVLLYTKHWGMVHENLTA